MGWAWAALRSGVPRWCAQNPSCSSSWVGSIRLIIRSQPYSTAPSPSHGGEEDGDPDEVRQEMLNRWMFRAAQTTFRDYLHATRGLCFTDAKHISERSPVFLGELLDEVKVNKAVTKAADQGEDEARLRSKVKKRVSRALVRLFHRRPVNEFRPFFESIGLRPSECDYLLPQDLTFLADAEMLLESCHALCSYGIARRKIGRIYWNATEVFSLGQGVLASKLEALEGLGFSKASVIKLVISTPTVLVHDPAVELKTFLLWLDDIGIQRDWIGQFLSERVSYNWPKMVQALQSLSDLGFTKDDIGKVVRKNPHLLLEQSGGELHSTVDTMQRVGSGKRELLDLFLNHPNVDSVDVGWNISKGSCFLHDIGISYCDVKKILNSHGWMFGAAPMKATSTILAQLNVGKARLRKIIMEEPCQSMNYTIGSKVSRLPRCKPEPCVKEKREFLRRIGFVEGSEDMEKALKAIRGKGTKLQDRYNKLVEKGLDPKHVAHMVKVAPRILNQKTDALAYKISFLVHVAGYPLSALPAFPRYLEFTVHKSKLKMLVYSWLLERGLAAPQLTLSTVLASSETEFIKAHHVYKVPMGREVWSKLKREGGSFGQEEIRWLRHRCNLDDSRIECMS
ncbi:transcription termination factor MTEF18, mitochondrial-like [Triticum urartu]|uniref:mTERF domain-containing protein 1, mitochondrial n=1 Tax=Triticum urartu TaxID=4572 RepID=A0A8R7TJC4_TRIUA|nr:transcription termination factor MTEF18, mitochondrial-like [Triticum urartu]